MKKGIFDIEKYSFEADTSGLARLENELKQDKEATSREWLEYQGAINEKVNELG